VVVGRIEGWRSWCARRSLSHVADGGMDMSVRIARMLKEWTAVVGEVGDQCRVRIAREREREGQAKASMDWGCRKVPVAACESVAVTGESARSNSICGGLN